MIYRLTFATLMIGMLCWVTGCVQHSGSNLRSETESLRRKFAEERQAKQAPLLAELGALDMDNGKVTLYTIDPASFKTDENYNPIPQPAGVVAFHDWKVIGAALVVSSSERKKLMSELIRGARESDGGVASCFEPRHALRIEANGKVIDVVVCFQCMQAQVFGASTGEGFLTSSSPVGYYNKLAKEHGLKVADLF